LFVKDKDISTALEKCVSSRETSKATSNDSDLSHDILMEEEVNRKDCPYITG